MTDAIEPTAPEEPVKAFKVLTDEEALEQGLPLVPTAEDIAEGERARAGQPSSAGPDPAPVPVSPLIEARPKTWAELPQRVRDELEAGRRALGGGGLSAEEAYNRSLEPPKPVPAEPAIVEEPRPEPNERAKLEMAAGAAVLRAKQAELERVQRVNAERQAKLLEIGAPANPATDLAYTAPKV